MIKFNIQYRSGDGFSAYLNIKAGEKRLELCAIGDGTYLAANMKRRPIEEDFLQMGRYTNWFQYSYPKQEDK